MAKDPWHKGRLGKIKNSPLGDIVRNAGKSVMGAIFEPGSCGSFSCDISDEHTHGTTKSGVAFTSVVPKTTVRHTDDEPMHAPNENHPESRSANLQRGATEHMDNVVDLDAYRKKKQPPEGY